MPIYEFHCDDCDVTFELLCPMICENIVNCEECLELTAYKIMSGGQAFDWNGNKPT